MAQLPAITVDRTSPMPLYFQVAEQVEHAIVSGHLQPGDKLENEIALARDLGLSRTTMRQAIQLLVSKGMLVRKRGVGTQVVHGQVRRSLELTSLYDDLTGAGQAPSTRVLSRTLAAAGRVEASVAEELQLGAGDQVWALERLRSIGSEPLAVMWNYLPPSVAALDEFDLTGEGLYASLRAAGVVMSVARQRIGSRGATEEEALLLGEEPGSPLLTMERTAYDNAGRPIELGRHVYRPGLYSFEMTLVG